jgi:hypothetical protein
VCLWGWCVAGSSVGTREQLAPRPALSHLEQQGQEHPLRVGAAQVRVQHRPRAAQRPGEAHCIHEPERRSHWGAASALSGCVGVCVGLGLDMIADVRTPRRSPPRR